MAKYPIEVKIAACKDYCERGMSKREICDKYGITYSKNPSSSALDDWIKRYVIKGEASFYKSKGNNQYLSISKLDAVLDYLSGNGSLRDIAAKYEIPSHNTLQRWISEYNANRELRDYDPKREVYMAEARRKTTIEERKEIVKYCIEHDRDYKGTASLYDVSYTQVYSWVRKYDDRFGHILGYRRMTLWINHFNGTEYKIKRIHRIMKAIGVHAIIRAKRKQYEPSTPETVAENTLKRDFHADKPNEKWTTDVTEFKIPEVNKTLYLSAILDLYDRSPVAYVLSNRNDNALVFRTFDKAIANNPDATPLFHSDYT